MDKNEMREIAIEQLMKLQGRPFAALKELMKKKEQFVVPGKSGSKYLIGLSAMWNEKPGGDLRVLITMNDAVLRTGYAVTEHAVISPQGLVRTTSLTKKEFIEVERKYPLKYLWAGISVIFIIALFVAIHFYKQMDSEQKLKKLQEQADEVRAKLDSGEMKRYQYQPPQ